MELPPPSGLLAAAAAAVGVLRCVSSASAEDAVGLRDHGSQLLSAEALAKELRGLRLKELRQRARAEDTGKTAHLAWSSCAAGDILRWASQPVSTTLNVHWYPSRRSRSYVLA